MSEPAVTPDERYIVVRGRLWRRSDPRQPAERRQELVDALMDARRSVGRALRSDAAALPTARAAVDAAKMALGERGPVWWQDGAPDLRAVSARRESAGDSHGLVDLIQSAGWMEAGMDGQAVIDGPAVASTGRG